MATSVHVFGVRHHGPGSARSLRRSLEALRPDCVLVEGPPDAHGVLSLLAHQQMTPPVALLVYAADERARAVYYPFAVFSPEWQAIEYALRRNVPVRFMDLPQAHRMALDKAKEAAAVEAPADQPPAEEAPASEEQIRRDPLGAIAEAAGYDDGERWWEHMVETRTDDPGLFAAVLEMMAALREKSPRREDEDDLLREAYMRRTLRAARDQAFERLAVVCGAWHAPVLAEMPDAAEDDAKLKGLPTIKVTATWVPWTYDRLAFSSGYGAGVTSPGWYHHLWECAEQRTSDSNTPSPPPSPGGRGRKPRDSSTPSGGSAPNPPLPPREGRGEGVSVSVVRPTPLNDASQHATIKWMTRVAHLLRAEDLDASPASVIEAVRLAETLAALRACPLPGLPELNESCTTVFCFGNDAPLRLIHRKLIVGESLGRVPDETPMVPLQADLQREQKRLRLPPDSEQKPLDLDLRKPNDLDRSRLLHRLELLGVPWGKQGAGRGYGAAKGTFHEIWQVQWQPEFAVALIEAAVWGNTVFDAVTAFARDRTDHAPDLPALTHLLDKVVLADLPAAVEHLMSRLQSQAALASDVAHLMGALPALANVLRYGNVRQADTAMIGHVVDGLVTRVCIGLPPATASLNDDAAAEMFNRVLETNDAIALLQNPEHLGAWHDTLRQLADREGLHGLLAGRAVRLLLDSGNFDGDEAARRMGFALSLANEPAHAAAWVEGLLKGSGLLLLHGDAIWKVVDAWLASLPVDTFTQVLPLLRRTFSTFEPPERRQMGERAKQGPARLAPRSGARSGAGDVDTARAEAVLPLILKILGLEAP